MSELLLWLIPNYPAYFRGVLKRSYLIHLKGPATLKPVRGHGLNKYYNQLIHTFQNEIYRNITVRRGKNCIKSHNT
jgi:hypothetical protein